MTDSVGSGGRTSLEDLVSCSVLLPILYTIIRRTLTDDELPLLLILLIYYGSVGHPFHLVWSRLVPTPTLSIHHIPIHIQRTTNRPKRRSARPGIIIVVILNASLHCHGHQRPTSRWTASQSLNIYPRLAMPTNMQR